MVTRIRLAATVLILTGLVGCGYARPLLPPGGTVQQQRYNASVHDPYADNDLGPAVVGARPRDFQKPLAEPVRNQWFQNSWWQR